MTNKEKKVSGEDQKVYDEIVAFVEANWPVRKTAVVVHMVSWSFKGDRIDVEHVLEVLENVEHASLIKVLEYTVPETSYKTSKLYFPKGTQFKDSSYWDC